MSRPRRCTVVATAVLLMAACSGESPPPESAPPAPSSPAPATTRASAFCLDLGTLQFAITHYRAGAGQAIEGEPLDFDELRRQADNIAWISEPMRADAPADIRADLDTVLDAIEASAKELTDGGSAKKLLDPLYGEENSPAFDAVTEYDCPE